MTFIVNITSQGQISIPAKIRRELGFAKTNKAIVSVEKGKILVEPVKDILDLAGSLKSNKKISPGKIRRGFEQYLADEGIKGLR